MTQVAATEHCTIDRLHNGRVLVLRNSFALDGRLSGYPVSARGYGALNCYLLVEEDGALLLDTGAACFAEQIIGQLGQVIDADTALSLFPLRINEFMSVGNATAIARRFNVVQCYSQMPDVQGWLEFDSLDSGAQERRRPIPTTLTQANGVEVGSRGGRKLAAFAAPLRLINTFWIYDEATRTLFTSDMFNHIWHDSAKGPWLLRREDDSVTDEGFVASFLLNTRYWWLHGAALDGIRREIADVFERYDIETIAPGFGAVLEGRDMVERQFSVLDSVLRKADRSNAKAHYVPRGLER